MYVSVLCDVWPYLIILSLTIHARPPKHLTTPHQLCLRRPMPGGAWAFGGGVTGECICAVVVCVFMPYVGFGVSVMATASASVYE